MSETAKQQTDQFAEWGDFPGARVLRMPFKDAVEAFIKAKYGDRVGKDLTLFIIRQEYPALREAVKTYKKRFGCSPFDIPSIRDIARERVAKVLENGFMGTRLDRQAVMKMINRQSRKSEPERPPNSGRKVAQPTSAPE